MSESGPKTKERWIYRGLDTSTGGKSFARVRGEKRQNVADPTQDPTPTEGQLPSADKVEDQNNVERRKDPSREFVTFIEKSQPTGDRD